MRMGLYYYGGYDWPYNDALLSNPADSFLAVPHTPDYVEYATTHVRELVSRYRPSVLWNDICWPTGGDLPALFAEYYNTVGDGVINDRWIQPPQHRGPVADPRSRTGTDPFQVTTDCLQRCVESVINEVDLSATGTGLPLQQPTGSGFWSIQPGVTWLYPTDPVVFFESQVMTPISFAVLISGRWLPATRRTSSE